MTTKFTVAICGGGVAGLTAAIAISHFSAERKDILVDLYEATPSFTEVGAGIGMHKRTWRVMKALGLEEGLRGLAEVPESDDDLVPEWEARKSDQAEGVMFSYPKIPFGAIFFHRADFQQCLVRHLDQNVIRIHFSKRLVGFTISSPSVDHDTPNRITLTFKDGSEAQCDVLIGADGIHSTTRHIVLDLVSRELENPRSDEERELAESLNSPGKRDPIWTGSIAYRALVPRERLEALNPSHRTLNRMVNYTGKNKHIIVFPITHGKLINVVAFVSQPGKEGTPFEGPWVSNRDKAEVLAAYGGWATEVQQLVQCMDSPSAWAIHSLDRLPIYTYDRAAIIGDAAHAMTPHLGAGAGVAIEDGYILGALLAHPRITLSTLTSALKIYESVCLRHANDVQRRSRVQGLLYEFNDPRFTHLAGRIIVDTNESKEDMADLRALGDAFMANRRWEWETDAEDNLRTALSLLEDETPPQKQEVS